MNHHRTVSTIASLLAVSSLLAACSSDGGNASSPAGGGSEQPAKPGRIVSLSPTATESLFAIGAGDQVVAADEYSNYPAQAPHRDGLSGYRPNAESILKENPELVVVSNQDEALTKALDAAQVRQLVLPAAKSLDEAYSQIDQLGKATGHEEGAAKTTATMREEVHRAVESVDPKLRDSHLKYFHEVSPDLYSVTSSTFLGQVYELFGLESIATKPADDPKASDYPKLTGEAVVQANPQVMFLADAEPGANAGAQAVTPASVAARPGWENIAAVRDHRIYPLDKDLSSRWGPRLGAFVHSIADALNQQPQAPHADRPAA